MVLILNYVYRQYFNFRTEGNTITSEIFIKVDLVMAIASFMVFHFITTHDYRDLVNE